MDQIFKLFPLPVLQRNLASSIDSRLLEDLFALAKDKTQLEKNKGNNYFTKDRQLLTTRFKDSTLAAEVQTSLDYFVKEIYGEQANIRITQSWLNFNPPGTCHPPHNHANSVLSGVVYLNVDEKTGSFKIYKPAETYRRILDTTETHNEFTYLNYEFFPNFGDLFLFDSSIVHGVEINQSEETRVSLAFNSFYTGNISASKLAELTI